MSILLGLDTATRTQSLALTKDGVVLARRYSTPKKNHADTLLRNIDDMLEQQGVTVQQIDAVGVGIGPGSFTGLRVGLSVAKGIALAADATIHGCSSLAAIARPVTALRTEPVVAATDARRGEVYFAVYQSVDGEFRCQSEARSISPAGLIDALLDLESPFIVGNALSAYPEFAQHAEPMAQPWWTPSPVSIAMFTVTIPASDLAALEPDYIRLSDAELALAKSVP